MQPLVGTAVSSCAADRTVREVRPAKRMEATPLRIADATLRLAVLRLAVLRLAESRLAVLRLAESRLAVLRLAESRLARY